MALLWESNTSEILRLNLGKKIQKKRTNKQGWKEITILWFTEYILNTESINLCFTHFCLYCYPSLLLLLLINIFPTANIFITSCFTKNSEETECRKVDSLFRNVRNISS